MDPDWPDELELYCDCPYGYNCKHGAAMMLALADGAGEAPRVTAGNHDPAQRLGAGAGV